MLKNYFKAAIRSIIKSKVFSLINVTGLAIGLATVMVIVSYVRVETSYDRFHENNENIYRVAVSWEDDGQQVNMAANHSPMANILKTELPGVIHTLRMFRFPVVISIDKTNRIKEKDFVFADSTFFDVFQFERVDGILKTSLDAPRSVVITRSAALRHFGTYDVLGEDIIFEDTSDELAFRITGIIEDFPVNSHFKADFIASFSTLDQFMPWYNNWHYPSMYVYLETNGSYPHEKLDAMINEVVESRLPGYVLEEDRNYFLQPIADIHLHSELEQEWQANSSHLSIKFFTLIAVFVLVIASINFVNLVTAQSLKRSKEVGVRKVMGAARKQLIFQILTESLITILIAFILAFSGVEFLLSGVLGTLTGQEVSLVYLLDWPYVGYVISGLVLLSLISGIYPAIRLSAYSPLSVMKPEVAGSSGIGIRRGLVVFQFFVSSLLIIGTLVVLEQSSFLRNKKLGFDKEHIVALRLSDDHSQKNYKVLKESLLVESSVSGVTLSSTLPAKGNFYGLRTQPENYGSDKDFSFKSLGVDEDFLATYDVKLVEGRDFSKEILTDQQEAVILNQAAIEKLSWQDPIGKEFTIHVHTDREEVRDAKVIGVVENFHFESLYEEVEPLIIYINKHPYYADFLSVRFEPGNLEASISLLTEKWQEFNTERPVEYYFLDQELQNLYQAELNKTKLLTAFAALSIIISCMGLFGLSIFTVQQKTKEIGIRKVLGASVPVIIRMLSKEYVAMIFMANLLALPVAWYLIHRWLANFAYHIDIGLWVFLISIISGLLIALITTSFQAVKAAMANPVNSLRDEYLGF